MTPVSSPVVRADATRNREALLRAALDEYNTGDGPLRMHEVARRAGVGVGTAYRHFPTPNDLTEALALDRFAQLVGIAERAADSSTADAERALGVFLADTLQMTCDPGLTRLIMHGTHSNPETASLLARFHSAVEVLVTVARASGLVREEIGANEFVALVHGVMLASRETGRVAELAPVFAAVLAAGMRAGPARG